MKKWIWFSLHLRHHSVICIKVSQCHLHQCKIWHWKHSDLLLIQRMKRSGPSTDPRGTPLVPVSDLDVKHCVLSKTLLLHQPTVCSDSPLAMSLRSKIALYRSIRMGTQCCFLFNVVMKSFITLKGCCSCAVPPMVARCRFQIFCYSAICPLPLHTLSTYFTSVY